MAGQKDMDFVYTLIDRVFRLTIGESPIRQWGMRYRSFNLKKYALYLSLIPRYLASAEMRSRLSRDQVRANRQLFEREVLDHYRIVFEKF